MRLIEVAGVEKSVQQKSSGSVRGRWEVDRGAKEKIAKTSPRLDEKER
jgi:hypothetical protein